MSQCARSLLLANSTMVTSVKLLLSALLPLLSSLAVYAKDIDLRPVEIANDESYWKQSGFVEMVPPLRLPTDRSNDNQIKVWLRIPEGRKIALEWLEDQKRYTLRFPPGTVADRVETMKNQQNAMHVINGIEDVRGAMIDRDGNTRWHVYEPVPGEKRGRLKGYEWLRTDDKGDDLAADSLIELFYPQAGAEAQDEIRLFRRLNQCGACHQVNRPAPTNVGPPFPAPANFLTDSHGFFQPVTVLETRMIVRDSRKWDLNADDPFIAVWCGTRQTRAITDGDRRYYKCPDGAVPIGELQLSAALKSKDAHALQVCESRRYLYQHMDQKARDVYRSAFVECSMR